MPYHTTLALLALNGRTLIDNAAPCNCTTTYYPVESDSPYSKSVRLAIGLDRDAAFTIFNDLTPLFVGKVRGTWTLHYHDSLLDPQHFTGYITEKNLAFGPDGFELQLELVVPRV